MITPNNNGKIEIDISAREKYAINVDLVDESFEVDATPSAEQKIINLDNYLSINNEKPYTPTGDYNPSTKKYIDDIIKNFKSLNIEKVNTAFMGFKISKGKHDIKFTYSSPLKNIGIILSIVGTISLILVCYIESKQKSYLSILFGKIHPNQKDVSELLDITIICFSINNSTYSVLQI